MDNRTLSPIIYLGIVIFILISGSSGRYIESNYHGKVLLVSDVVEFEYVSLNRTTDNITVSWLFHNIANRTLNLSIKAEFYDKNGNMLFSKVNELLKFPANYTEHLLLPANKISYNGKEASKVDYVILRVSEVDNHVRQ